MIISKVKIEQLSLEEPEIKSALKNNQLIVGPHIEEFESNLASLFNFNFSATSSSGFAALFLLINAIGCKRSKIIVPSVSTCFSIVNAVLASGNLPVFCDLDPETLSLDIRSVESLCNKNKISLIIDPSHFGMPAKINNLQRFGIPIIEDACQAFHTRIKHKSNADFLILSFYPTKFFNTIEGGAILCNDITIFNKIKDIRYYDKQTKYDGRSRFNLRMPNLNAAIGISQIREVQNQQKRLEAVKRQYLLIRDQLPDHFFSNQFEPGIIPWRLLIKINDNDLVKSIYQAGIEISHELIYCGLNLPNQEMHELIEKVYSLPYYADLDKSYFKILNTALFANV